MYASLLSQIKLEMSIQSTPHLSIINMNMPAIEILRWKHY